MDKKSLSNMSLKELQALAEEKKIKVASKAKKSEIVDLILEHTKVSEAVEEKRQQLSDKNPSSGAASSQAAKVNETRGNQEFNNIPAIPDKYGKSKLILMIRDPYWGFIYWDMDDALVRDYDLTSIDRYLRVYDISETDDPSNNSGFFDIRLTAEATNWYIKFPQSNRSYIVDFGIFKDGKFITLLRSNKGGTPREDVSNIVDIEWMSTDVQFADIMRASGGDRLFERIGSQEMVKFIAANVNEEKSVSSGGVSAGLSALNLSMNLSSGSLSSSSISASVKK